MLAVHFLQGVQEIIGVGEGNEAVASGFACPAISNHSCHLEGGIATEDGAQDLVVDLVAEISTEDPVIILWPVLHSLILPYFSRHFPHHSLLLLHLLFDLLPLSWLSFPFLFSLSLHHLFLFLHFLLPDVLGFVVDGLLDLERIHVFDFEHDAESFI